MVKLESSFQIGFKKLRFYWQEAREVKALLSLSTALEKISFHANFLKSYFVGSILAKVIILITILLFHFSKIYIIMSKVQRS